MKLLIVRHGDPNYELDTLTPTGWKEAQLLSQRLKKLDVKAFYVSPLGRAQDTASVTLKEMGRQAQTCPWLREFAVRVQKPYEDKPDCAWDWMPAVWTKDEAAYDYQSWSQWEGFRGTLMAEEYRWVTENFDALLAQHGYVRQGKVYRAQQPNEDTLVFFCHFGLECVLLSHLLGISPMVLWHGTCAAPTSVTTVVTEERQKGIAAFRMSSFGDVSHLYAAGAEPSFSARFCEVFP